MKNRINYTIITLMVILSFSCGKKETKETIINETELINKLSENNFYKEFFSYNIRPREEGRVYMIETDSIKEFWVNFDENTGITLSKSDEIYLDKKLKSIYSDKYLEVKETIIAELNKLISFMFMNGIKYTVNIERKKIYFGLINGSLIERYNNAIVYEEIESLKNFYDSVIVIDDNWVILKKPKM